MKIGSYAPHRFLLDLVNSLAGDSAFNLLRGVPSAVRRDLGLCLGDSEGGVALADRES